MYMETTLFLAKFLGLFSIIFSVAIILRRKMIVHLLKEFVRDRALAFMVGIAEMAAGLLVVLYHFKWDNTLESAISILGIAMVLEGTFYLFARQKTIKKLVHSMDSVSGYYFFAVLYLILGVYLAYTGFGLGA